MAPEEEKSAENSMLEPFLSGERILLECVVSEDKLRLSDNMFEHASPYSDGEELLDVLEKKNADLVGKK